MASAELKPILSSVAKRSPEAEALPLFRRKKIAGFASVFRNNLLTKVGCTYQPQSSRGDATDLGL